MTEYERLTDEELIARIRSGDYLAEEFLYGKYKKAVRGKARSYYLAGAEYDDLIQEGMIGLYHAVREYSPDRSVSFQTFADRCITRQILTAVRLANRKKHVPLNTYISFSQPISSGEDSERTLADILESTSSGDPEQEYLVRETYKAVSSDIQDLLTPVEKKTLSLYLRGLSYQQIADDLGKTKKYVDNAIQRIKRKLSQKTAQ